MRQVLKTVFITALCLFFSLQYCISKEPKPAQGKKIGDTKINISSVPVVSTNVYKSKVLFNIIAIDPDGVMTDLPREIEVAPPALVKGDKIKIKDIYWLDDNQKIKLLIEQLVLGLTDNEKDKGNKSFINKKTKLKKCLLSSREDYPEEQKIELEFDENIVELIDSYSLEQIQTQLVWTLKLNGYDKITYFDYRVNGKSLTYYLRNK